MINIVPSKTTIFVICCKNEFNYSHVFNDFSRVSFKTIVIVVYLKVVSTTLLLVCFLHLTESTCETKKNVFYFTLKTLFVLEIIKF